MILYTGLLMALFLLLEGLTAAGYLTDLRVMTPFYAFFGMSTAILADRKEEQWMPIDYEASELPFDCSQDSGEYLVMYEA
jgi:hypothetical protein